MNQRTCIGLLLAAMLVPVAAAVGLVFNDFSLRGIQAAFGYAAMLAVFTLPITLLVGLPLLIWYRRAHWHAWYYFVFGGAVLGLLPVLVFAAAGTVSVTFALGFTVGGALSALLLWYFTGRVEGQTDGVTGAT